MLASLDWSHLIIALLALGLGFGYGFTRGVKDERYERALKDEYAALSPEEQAARDYQDGWDEFWENLGGPETRRERRERRIKDERREH